jgi:hypothetical protein
MTDYEVLELRHYYRAESATAFRYWVSLNFAVLVAAYAVGGHLNLLTVSIILTLYVMVTYSNQRVLQSIGADQQALADQIKQMNDTTEAISPAMNVVAEGTMGIRSFLVVAFTLRAFLFIGTVFFVLYQAGYVG